MEISELLPPSPPGRLRLSSRGVASAAAYRIGVTAIRGRTQRNIDQHANARWATDHGLEPADGPYLVELAPRPLTLEQLAEALAIHSQSRQMIDAVVNRLLALGFIDQESLRGYAAH